MTQRCTLFALALITATAAGCTQFPQLDHTQSDTLRGADYPALVPIEPILAGVETPTTDAATEEAALTSRLAGLRARANRIRGSVITEAEKKRLKDGLR